MRTRDGFRIYAPAKNAEERGRRLIETSGARTNEGLTLKDLIEFLELNDIKPEDVCLPYGFAGQTALALRISDVIRARPYGELLPMRKVAKEPGVYRLVHESEDRPGPAAMVVTTRGELLYVDGKIIDHDGWKANRKAMVRRTRCPAPFKVLVN